MNQHEHPDFDGFGTIPGLEHLGRAITDFDGQPSGSPANYSNLRGARHPDGHAAARAAASADAIADLRDAFAGVGSAAATAERVLSDPETDGDVPILTRIAAPAPELADGDREDRPKPNSGARRRNGGKVADGDN